MATVVDYYKVCEADLRSEPYNWYVIANCSSEEQARGVLDEIAFKYRFRKPRRIGDKLYIKKEYGYVRGWKITKSYRLLTT